MKTFIFLILLSINTISALAQIGCDPTLNSNMPPSPYVDGFLTFDGKGDFLRSGDLNPLEFPVNSTDSFSICTSFKIAAPYRAMIIFGKCRTAGWMLGYNINESGYICIFINNTWKRVYQLGADTSWHDYEIKYNKPDQTLKIFVDGVLTNLYPDFTYASMADNSAFSVGNVGFFPQFGPQSVNVSSLWFKGSIAEIKIFSNANCVVNYGFNEGSGQVARDSLTYFFTDRSYPGYSTCGISHLMMGYMLSPDTCDPEWSSFDNPVQSRFSPLGTGTQYWYSNEGMEFFAEHFSTAMTVHNGNLINGGYFNLAGGNPAKCIASWNGSTWSPLGSGLNHEPVGLISFNGELYAGGFFDSAGGVPVKYVAKWNGSQWQNVGRGFNSVVNTFCEFNGRLIAGGWFTSSDTAILSAVAMWDGENWVKMGTGMNGTVYTFAVFRGELYAGGCFNTANGQPASGIARWDGNKWNPVGTGVTGGDKTIFALAVYNDELYAGGTFIKMGDDYCYNIAKYDGSFWRALGSGADGAYCIPSRGYINTLKVCNNELYAGGQFSRINNVAANKLARFNGINWCSVEYGVDLRPKALEVFENELIVNGEFYSASGVECNNIVKYSPIKNLTGIQNYTAPVTFKLEQNYPNPFNPKTKVGFRIAETGFVSLKIFDVTGRQVAVLAEKEMNPGHYDFEFDGNSYSSGIYIYRLESTGKSGDKNIESKKMILIK